MKRFSVNELQELAEVLKMDKTVSVPTDTVYGVCARITEAGQENLREVKNRPATKAFPIMCADKEQMKTIVEVDARAEKLIDAFFPGPATMILKKKAGVPAFVNGGMETIAVRMATSDVLKELITAVGMPLFMTSANQSGEKTATSLDEIEQACPLLSGMLEGETQFGEASTIMDCTGEEVKILRQGPITMEAVLAVLQ